MVEEYLSDREQEEKILAWWRENWRWVLGGIALGIAVLGALQYWQSHLQARAESASQAFRNLTTALSSHDNNKAEAATKELDSLGASPYADQAHLLLAQTKVSAGQFEQAAEELKTVVDKSKDLILAQVARLRLARVQIQLGHFDAALALLDVDKAGAFAAQVHEARGDALLAKGDRSGARLEYQAALNGGIGAAAGAADSDAEVLRLKLQDLAGESSATSSTNSAVKIPVPTAPAATK